MDRHAVRGKPARDDQLPHPGRGGRPAQHGFQRGLQHAPSPRNGFNAAVGAARAADGAGLACADDISDGGAHQVGPVARWRQRRRDGRHGAGGDLFVGVGLESGTGGRRREEGTQGLVRNYLGHAGRRQRGD
ncbi:hypothetical protein G6F35_017249 [Rhizopus arrhizus]|nr:hypothetical protein G6F35_017249 [Rhizopus arrhizus]